MKKSSRRPEVESLESIRLLSSILPSARPSIASVVRHFGQADPSGTTRLQASGHSITTTLAVTRSALPSRVGLVTGLASAPASRPGLGFVNTSDTLASSGVSRGVAIASASINVAVPAATARPVVTFEVQAPSQAMKLR